MQPKTMTATNKETGQRITFSWDKPGNPTDQDLDRIFAQNSQQQKPKVSSPFQMPGVQGALDKAAAYPGSVQKYPQGQGNAGIDIAAMAQADADRKLGKVNPVQASPVKPEIPPMIKRPEPGDPNNQPLTLESLKQRIAEMLR